MFTAINLFLLIVISAYCTGLLLARRVLKTLEMDEEYEGKVEVYTSSHLIFHVDCLLLFHFTMFYFVFNRSINFLRLQERIIQLNHLRLAGHSVLFWMLGWLGLLQETVFSVPLRYFFGIYYIFLSMTTLGRIILMNFFPYLPCHLYIANGSIVYGVV